MKLYKISNRYAVESELGFIVDRTGSPIKQFVVHYREGGKVIDYPIENLAPGSITRISIAAIKNWNNPHDQEKLSYEKKKEIAERIVAAMVFLGDQSCVIK
jgi:hypothetical protein